MQLRYLTNAAQGRNFVVGSDRQVRIRLELRKALLAVVLQLVHRFAAGAAGASGASGAYSCSCLAAGADF